MGKRWALGRQRGRGRGKGKGWARGRVGDEEGKGEGEATQNNSRGAETLWQELRVARGDAVTFAGHASAPRVPAEIKAFALLQPELPGSVGGPGASHREPGDSRRGWRRGHTHTHHRGGVFRMTGSEPVSWTTFPLFALPCSCPALPGCCVGCCSHAHPRDTPEPPPCPLAERRLCSASPQELPPATSSSSQPSSPSALASPSSSAGSASGASANW